MEIVTIWWGEQNVTWLKKNEWVLICYINVILQLSQLSTKQVAVVQRVPDEDSNIINRAADDLVGLSFCLRIYLLCFLHTHIHTYVYIVYILCLRVALTTFFNLSTKYFLFNKRTYTIATLPTTYLTIYKHNKLCTIDIWHMMFRWKKSSASLGRTNTAWKTARPTRRK